MEKKTKFEKMFEMMRNCCTGEKDMADCCSMMKKMMKCGEAGEPTKEKKETGETSPDPFPKSKKDYRQRQDRTV